jgi:hypothetical protein
MRRIWRVVLWLTRRDDVVGNGVCAMDRGLERKGVARGNGWLIGALCWLAGRDGLYHDGTGCG